MVNLLNWYKFLFDLSIQSLDSNSNLQKISNFLLKWVYLIQKMKIEAGEADAAAEAAAATAGMKDIYII